MAFVSAPSRQTELHDLPRRTALWLCTARGPTTPLGVLSSSVRSSTSLPSPTFSKTPSFSRTTCRMPGACDGAASNCVRGCSRAGAGGWEAGEVPRGEGASFGGAWQAGMRRGVRARCRHAGRGAALGAAAASARASRPDRRPLVLSLQESFGVDPLVPPVRRVRRSQWRVCGELRAEELGPDLGSLSARDGAADVGRGGRGVGRSPAGGSGEDAARDQPPLCHAREPQRHHGHDRAAGTMHARAKGLRALEVCARDQARWGWYRVRRSWVVA